MYTINLEQLKASPSYKFLSDDFKAAITEYIPELPVLVAKNAPLPAYTLDPVKSTITLAKPIRLADILQIYNSTTSTWIFLSGVGYERYQKITLSGDGLVIQCQPGSLKSATDKISSAIIAEFKVTDTLPMFVAPAVEWLQPILILDPKQINDKTTYDGSFAIYENEVKSLYAPSATGACLWMYITDFNRIFAKQGQPVDIGVAKAALFEELDSVKSQLDYWAVKLDNLKTRIQKL